jgi:hypothetical protein
VADQGEVRDTAVEVVKSFAVGGGRRRVYVGKHVGNLFDGLAIHGAGVGACVGDGGGLAAEDWDLAVGGVDVEIAALDVAQDDAQRRYRLGSGDEARSALLFEDGFLGVG